MGGNPPSDGLTPCVLRLGKSHVTPDGARASVRLKVWQLDCQQDYCLEPGLIEVLVPVRPVEGVRRKKLASGLNDPTQGLCKKGA